MMMQQTLLSLLALVACFLPLAQAQKCTLCATASQRIVNGRWAYRFSDGTTCQSAYLQTINLQSTSSTCSTIKSKYQYKCCNPNADVGTQNSTPRLPAYVGPVGTEPDCPICGTSEYPGKPNQLIVARYVGEYTCGQLFSRGFYGMTPEYMCGALQDFAFSVCGCGRYNPVCRTDSTKCYGGSNYKAPYIIPFDTQISSSTEESTTSSNPGSRNLRGGAGELPASATTSGSVEDLHFESKEAEENDVRSLTEEGSSEVDEEAEVLSSQRTPDAVEEPLLEATR